MNRAYSVIRIKSFDEERRTITGLASSPSVDRTGDVVEPDGATFRLPLPFLMGHDAAQPIGHVTSANVSNSGIAITAQITKFTEPGALRDRLENAWQSIKSGLIRGLSIGFRSLESVRNGKQGLRFLAYEILEISAVVIPANQDATIQTVKHFDIKSSPRQASYRLTGHLETDLAMIVQAQRERAAAGLGR